MPERDDIVLTPSQAASFLGISTTGLRRLARAYETRFGALPRTPREGRRWTQTAVERLRAAREFAAAGEATGVEHALDILYPQARPDETHGSALAPRSSTALALANELRRIREANERQLEHLETLRRQNERIHAELATLGELRGLTDVILEVAGDLRTQLERVRHAAGPQAAERIIGLFTPLYEGLAELKEAQERNAGSSVDIAPLVDTTLRLTEEKHALERHVEHTAGEKTLLEEYNTAMKTKLARLGQIMPEEMEEIRRLRIENERLKIKVNLLQRQLERERDEAKSRGVFARLFGTKRSE